MFKFVYLCYKSCQSFGSCVGRMSPSACLVNIGGTKLRKNNLLQDSLTSLCAVRRRYIKLLILWVLMRATFIYICFKFLSSHVNDNQETACIFHHTVDMVRNMLSK